MINEIRKSIVRFCRTCDKPTLFFALAAVNQVVGFTPGIPAVAYYAIMIGYALYCLSFMRSFNAMLVAFLFYVPMNILVSQPDAIFRPWERYVLFSLMLAANSPLLQGGRNRHYRSMIFKIVLFSCAFLGAGSFFARFVGINYGSLGLQEIGTGVGLFGGLTLHSMLLGPIAGIGSLYMSMMWYRTKRRIWLFFAVCCLLSVMFSASRSALMAAIAANVVMLYKMSGTGSRFAKYGMSAVIIGALSYPLWSGALDDVMAKQSANVEAGGTFESRSSKWEARVAEFKSSPLVGVGFAAVDLNNAKAMDDTNADSGVVETGSSWLCIFSMTGLIGALLLLPLFFTAFMTAWRSHAQYASVVVGMLVLFYVHMLAEGYALAGGSFLAFCLWLSVGLGYDCKYEKEMAL